MILECSKYEDIVSLSIIANDCVVSTIHWYNALVKGKEALPSISVQNNTDLIPVRESIMRGLSSISMSAIPEEDVAAAHGRDAEAEAVDEDEDDSIAAIAAEADAAAAAPSGLSTRCLN